MVTALLAVNALVYFTGLVVSLAHGLAEQDNGSVRLGAVFGVLFALNMVAAMWLNWPR